MGHIGTLADGVEVGFVGIGQLVFNILEEVKGIVLSVFDGVKGILLGIFDGVKGIALNILDGLRSVWGKLWGIGEVSQQLNAGVDIEVANAASGSGTKAYLPPSYEVSFSK